MAQWAGVEDLILQRWHGRDVDGFPRLGEIRAAVSLCSNEMTNEFAKAIVVCDALS